MSNRGLIKSCTVGAAVSARRIVKWGAADFTVIQGAAATDFLVGVTGELGATNANGDTSVDVALTGLADVQYGGAVTRGDPLTSDANGKAVAAAPGAGVNNRIIGFAWVSGVLDDIGQVQLAPGRIQG